MADDEREVTVSCPRCGAPFIFTVRPLDVGHEIDVAEWSCDRDLTEDEYEDLRDVAIAAFEAGESKG